MFEAQCVVAAVLSALTSPPLLTELSLNASTPFHRKQ
jgi:hypothetical protein